MRNAVFSGSLLLSEDLREIFALKRSFKDEGSNFVLSLNTTLRILTHLLRVF